MPPVTGRETPSHRWNWASVLGLALGTVGLVVYGLAIYELGAYMPSVRNDALPSWLLLAAGIAVSIIGVRRAFAQPRRLGGSVLASAALATNVIFATVLAWILYSMAPLPATRGPEIGAPAPHFALQDHNGTTVRLEDFRGSPLLLVFYRGHW